CDLAHAARHVVDSGRSQKQAIAHGAVESGGLDVFVVGGEDAFFLSFEHIGNLEEQRVLVLGGELRQMGGCGTGTEEFVASGSGGAGSSSHQLPFCGGK